MLQSGEGQQKRHGCKVEVGKLGRVDDEARGPRQTGVWYLSGEWGLGD